MRNPFLFLLGLLLLLGMAGQASALTLSNGSFETGNFSGWTINSTNGGATDVVQTSTSSDSDNSKFDITYSATAGTYFAQLKADSSVYQSLTWDAGETITFDWAFQAFDYLPYNDYAYFKVAGTTQTLSSVSDVGNYGETPWATYSYTFGSAGTGNIEFGVLNLLDNNLPSKLLIDNVTATSNAAPVPEPATLFLFSLGLLGLAKVNRKKLQE